MCKHFNLINKRDTAGLLRRAAISICIIQVHLSLWEGKINKSGANIHCN